MATKKGKTIFDLKPVQHTKLDPNKPPPNYGMWNPANRCGPGHPKFNGFTKENVAERSYKAVRNKRMREFLDGLANADPDFLKNPLSNPVSFLHALIADPNAEPALKLKAAQTLLPHWTGNVPQEVEVKDDRKDMIDDVLKRIDQYLKKDSDV